MSEGRGIQDFITFLKTSPGFSSVVHEVHLQAPDGTAYTNLHTSRSVTLCITDIHTILRHLPTLQTLILEAVAIFSPPSSDSPFGEKTLEVLPTESQLQKLVLADVETNYQIFHRLVTSINSLREIQLLTCNLKS